MRRAALVIGVVYAAFSAWAYPQEALAIAVCCIILSAGYLIFEMIHALDDPIDDAFDQLANGDTFPVIPDEIPAFHSTGDSL